MDIGEDGLLAFNEREYSDPRTNPVKGAYTPLAAELHEQIKVRGPLTVADFMYHCMQNPQHGYYMTKQHVIGAPPSAAPSASSSVPLGDFITSPEISQLFGELLGVWLVDAWQKLGRPPSFHLVELGPGRGSLVKDVLRVFRHFPSIHSAVQLHLVETSPLMREQQREALGVRLQPSASPFYSSTLVLPPASSRMEVFASPAAQFGDDTASGFTAERVRVTWHSGLKSLPVQGPVFVLAHEFLDALPVYQFQYGAERGWTELLVDADYSSQSPYHFRFCLAPVKSPAANALMGGKVGKDGDRVEMGVSAMTVVEDVTQRVGAQGGCALFIDYGFVDRAEIGGAPLTLQAIQRHTRVHPLHEPGWTDLTALVDFAALSSIVQRTAAIKALPVFALPLITQSSFLRNMGIAARLERLIEAVEEKAEGRTEADVSAEVDGLLSGATRLVSEAGDGMGRSFKVLGIVHEKIGTDVAAWDEREVREKRDLDRRQRSEQSGERQGSSAGTSAAFM